MSGLSRPPRLILPSFEAILNWLRSPRQDFNVRLERDDYSRYHPSRGRPSDRQVRQDIEDRERYVRAVSFDPTWVTEIHRLFADRLEVEIRMFDCVVFWLVNGNNFQHVASWIVPHLPDNRVMIIEGDDMPNFRTVSPLSWFAVSAILAEHRIMQSRGEIPDEVVTYFTGVTGDMEDGSRIAIQTLCGQAQSLVLPPPDNRPPTTFQGTLDQFEADLVAALERSRVFVVVDVVPNYQGSQDRQRIKDIINLLIRVAEGRPRRYNLRVLITSTYRLGVHATNPNITRFCHVPHRVVEDARNFAYDPRNR